MVFKTTAFDHSAISPRQRYKKTVFPRKNILGNTRNKHFFSCKRAKIINEILTLRRSKWALCGFLDDFKPSFNKVKKVNEIGGKQVGNDGVFLTGKVF